MVLLSFKICLPEASLALKHAWFLTQVLVRSSFSKQFESFDLKLGFPSPQNKLRTTNRYNLFSVHDSWYSLRTNRVYLQVIHAGDTQLTSWFRLFRDGSCATPKWALKTLMLSKSSLLPSGKPTKNKSSFTTMIVLIFFLRGYTIWGKGS